MEMIRDGIKYIKARRRSPLKIKGTQISVKYENCKFYNDEFTIKIPDLKVHTNLDS